MKNLWLRLKLFCFQKWYGISEQDLNRVLLENHLDRMQADALLYGIGISRVEPEEFYGIGTAELLLNDLQNQMIDRAHMAVNRLPVDIGEVKRHLKAAKKHKKVGRKKHGK